MSAIEISGDLKPGLGLGGASVVEDFLVRIQWFSGPVFGDFREETMFDRIPLGGTSGIVSHGYGESEGVGQLRLELGFPGVTAATVAAAGIGEKEQLVGSAIAGGTFLVPPMSDGMSGKGGSIVRDANHQSPTIFRNIVNSIGNGDTDGVGAKVVIIDTTRGRLPTPTGIFEIADELAFFAVHADDGQMATLEAVAQLGQIFELKIAVGTRARRDLLLIDAQGIVHVMKQAGDGIGRDGNAKFDQLLGDGGSGAARPA